MKYDVERGASGVLKKMEPVKFWRHRWERFESITPVQDEYERHLEAVEKEGSSEFIQKETKYGVSRVGDVFPVTLIKIDTSGLSPSQIELFEKHAAIIDSGWSREPNEILYKSTPPDPLNK